MSSRRRKATDTDGFTICPIPFVHIKNGILGLKGHVCSFPQRVQDLYTILPRLPSSATFVKMIRSFKGEESEFGVKSFFVR
jgi:hypothetical protein